MSIDPTPGSIRHPMSMQTYRAESPHRVRVESHTAWGVFTENGEWLEGPIRSADPTFCRWVASGRLLQERAAAKSQ
jgi:hypothetical protein